MKRNYMNIGTKPKAFWKYVNSRIKICPTIDELHRSDGSSASSHSEIVNMFNEYFSSVFTCEDDFMPAFHTDDPHSTIDSLTITPQLVLNKLKKWQISRS